MMSNRQAKREAKQLFHLCHVHDLLDEDRVRQVVQAVVAAGHRGCPAVLGCFYRLIRLDRVRYTARIESATPLPADLQASVAASLTQRYGPGLIAVFAHLPSLIGGVRIQVGFDVFDGSVLADLSALEKSF